MLSFPADFITAADQIPPAEEWLIACLKMPSGDVWLSDRPASPELLALIPAEPLPAVENWGERKDGGTIDNFLSPGNLECPQQSITLLRADQTKADVDAIIQQGIHNRRFELYRWFSGMTSAPVLIDIMFCQDPIGLKESSALWSFDTVGALCSENPYITDRSNGNDVYPYVIGRAQGLRLQFLEEQSDPRTTLLDDLDDSSEGLIRVEDSSRFPPTGSCLINGEEFAYNPKSAGYLSITTRATGGTEVQAHRAGSRIFLKDSIFKYAVCAGPVGNLELLRTSNDLDTWDEDGDGDTDEYRNLYTGGNEVLHPELNPAQVWFNDRMPWLRENQDFQLTDKKYYGNHYSFSSAIDVGKPHMVNREDGDASVMVSFRRFSDPSDVWYQDTTITLPALPGDGPTYSASDNIVNNQGYFTISQSFGEFIWNLTSTAYREMRCESTCPEGVEGWTMVEAGLPDTTEYIFDEGVGWLNVYFQRVVTYKMDIKIEIHEVDPTGAEFLLHSSTYLGGSSGLIEHYPLGYFFTVPFINYDPYTANRRLKLTMTCLGNNAADSYAFMRVGSETIYSDEFHYGLVGFWRYFDSQPSAYLLSKFNRNFTNKGTFESAKIRVQGTFKNTEDKADGEFKILENDVEIYSVTIEDGEEIDTTVELAATTWTELRDTEIKLQTDFDYLRATDPETGEQWWGVPRTDGEAGINLNDGVQWLITYTGENLDGIQVQYTDSLLIDAVSIHGENETPASAIQHLVEGFSNWATDFLDTVDFSARHAEYVAATHYLNGTIDGGMKLQSAIRELCRQGFCRLLQNQGKIKLRNYITDSAGTLAMTADNDFIFQKSKEWQMTDTKEVIQKLVCNYDKNHSTGKYDGRYEQVTGEHVENYDQIDLDLVSSETAVQVIIDWFFAFRSEQLNIFIFDGNFKCLEFEKSDIINLPNFLSEDVGVDMRLLSATTIFGQGKNGKIPKMNLKLLKV